MTMIISDQYAGQKQSQKTRACRELQLIKINITLHRTLVE